MDYHNILVIILILCKLLKVLQIVICSFGYAVYFWYFFVTFYEKCTNRPFRRRGIGRR